jgi:hypothetical protein
MNLPAILLLIISSVLVLRTGERIDIVGAAREENGRVLFRVAGGALYSIPLHEVDAEATRSASMAQPEPEEAQKRLRVSPETRDRLLRELEKNHSGQPAPRSRLLETPPPLRTEQEIAAEQRSEWEWRQQARGYDEQLRYAEEGLQLLIDRAERLRGEIHGFLSLGFDPRQFTYQTTLLYYTLEQVPGAELSVKRAQRARDQFHEDARRQGVLPGWLR